MAFRLTNAMADALAAVRASRPGDATKIIQDALNLRAPGHGQTGTAPVSRRLPAPAAGESTESPAGTAGSRGRTSARRRSESGPVEPADGIAGSFTKQRYTCGAGSRDYFIYLPVSAKPRGLVVMLHGCKQQAQDFAAGTRMNGIAATENLIVVYPMQTATDNQSSCWNWFRTQDQERTGGEAEIIAGMATTVARQYRVPQTHVFAAGLSAGGAMAAILGAAYPDVFSAVGVHSGLPYRAARDVNGAFAAMRGAAPGRERHRFLNRLIIFHGTDDRTVVQANADELWNDVLAANSTGTVLSRERSENGRKVSQRLLVTEQKQVVAEEWIIRGLRHGWSGGDPRGAFMDSHGPDASREMVRFMLNTGYPE